VSWFPVPEESELPENLRGLFRKARETVGFVPNVFRAYSFRPERLSAWFAHYRQLHEPRENLDAAEREMIAVAVSMANGCLYCLVAHGAALRQALGDPILADRITLDYRRAGLDERRTAILDYAVKVTERPLDCTPEDLERLKGYGLAEEEVWDVIGTSCSWYKPQDYGARRSGAGWHPANGIDASLRVAPTTTA